MSQELAIIRSATASLSSVASATTAMISALKANGVVRAADRQRLKDGLMALRRFEVADHLARLGVVNMNHTFDLYDLAETKSGNPLQFSAALRIAEQSTRLLGDNLSQLGRELR